MAVIVEGVQERYAFAARAIEKVSASRIVRWGVLSDALSIRHVRVSELLEHSDFRLGGLLVFMHIPTGEREDQSGGSSQGIGRLRRLT